jgi:S1-C subfamily serine protease
VKLFVKKTTVSYSSPWKKASQSSSTGTGFLITERYIVTNAHVVQHATSILARAQTSPVKVSARVVALAIPADLALLEVDQDFWDGKKPLTIIEDLPELDENVTAIGFPAGGDQVSVTRGVVSRVDTREDGLVRIQIDAAINPGNSGGPVFNTSGLVVGVATATRRDLANVGFVTPSSVLRLFLTDVKSTNAYRGIPSLGIYAQTLESPVLRAKLGAESGVRVSSVAPLGTSAGILEPDDVLISVDGIEIGQDGTVPLRPSERINYRHTVTRKRTGDAAELVYLRGGERKVTKVSVGPQSLLVPELDGWDASPQYCIFGGLVFVALSRPWCLSQRNRFIDLLVRHRGPLPREGAQVVVLAKVLAHEVNIGYHNIAGATVASFNSVVPENLLQLARLIRAATTPTVEIALERSASCYGQDLIVLDREAVRLSEQDILDAHLIARPLSKDIEDDLQSEDPAQPAAEPARSTTE